MTNTEVTFDHNSMEFRGITPAILKKLKDTFQGIDVELEMKKMCLWLATKPARDKCCIGFIMNWLNKCDPQSPLNSVNEFFDMLEDGSELSNLYKEYLGDLWKHSGAVLKLNAIKRSNQLSP